MSKKKTDELVDLKDEVVDLMLYNFWDLEKQKKYHITIDDIKNLKLDEFWDKYFRVPYACGYKEYEGPSEMLIPIEHFSDLFNGLEKEMLRCSKITDIKISRYNCGKWGDTFKVYAMSGENVVIEYSYKSKRKGELPDVMVCRPIACIFYRLKYEYSNFLSEVRFAGSNGLGFDINLFKSDLIDIKQFIESNSDKYGIFYRYEEPMKSLYSLNSVDEKDKIEKTINVYYINEEWV